MNTQFTALRLAEALEAPLSAEWMKEITLDHIAAELRRLHEVNQELVEALQLAIDSHGYLLMSDPPQEAWKAYKVEAKARAALAKARGNT
jgi:hypothetical protein